MIPEPEAPYSVVADEAGHEWVKETETQWACYHVGPDNIWEFYWTWQQIVQDANGRLHNVF